jgi:hypothetical protein
LTTDRYALFAISPFHQSTFLRSAAAAESYAAVSGISCINHCRGAPACAGPEDRADTWLRPTNENIFGRNEIPARCGREPQVAECHPQGSDSPSAAHPPFRVPFPLQRDISGTSAGIQRETIGKLSGIYREFNGNLLGNYRKILEINNNINRMSKDKKFHLVRETGPYSFCYSLFAALTAF